MKKETNALKILAKEAKKRMKLYAQSSLHNPYKTSIMSKEDCELYDKVCKILSRDNITTNPINELIDKTYYEKLSPDARQRYILYLSDKYLALKAKYYQEKSSNVG